MPFDLSPDYKQVPERIADLKEKFPEARLRPTDPTRPYWIESVPMVDTATGETFDKVFIVYSASCFRDDTDTMPGIGVAWEPFPGTTPYTKNSELQNAETSAWGRAIIAALASESKSIASAEDVRNRSAEHNEPSAPSTYRQQPARPPRMPSEKQLSFLNNLIFQTGTDVFNLSEQGIVHQGAVAVPDLNGDEVKRAIDHLISIRDSDKKPSNPTAPNPTKPPRVVTRAVAPSFEPDDSDEPF